MTAPPPPSLSTPLPSSAHKRRTRTYLLNPRFQLKYTGLLVGVVLAVMLALGVLIWSTANEAASNAESAATQAERAIKESATSAQLLRMSTKEYGSEAADLERMLEEEQKKADRALEEELAKARAQRAKAVEQPRQMLMLLLGGGGTLLVLLAVLGIFITHRIVGPVFRLKRLCRQVGTSRLNVQVGPRKGDELEDLFDTFRQMVYSLKALQIGRLATLDATIAKAEAASVDPEILEGLRSVRAQLRIGLGGDGSRGSRVEKEAP